MKNERVFAIVLAKVDVTDEVANPGAYRADLGERPKLVGVRAPRACMWLNSGGPDDVLKAGVFAAREGFVVFAYPVGEPDPLGRAKREVLAR